MAMVTVYWVPELPWTATPNVPAEGVYCTLLTHNEVGDYAEFPVLLKVIKMLPWVASPLANVRFVIWPCSVAMKLKVRAPIHAATAMLTATVTAISMIEATTGLRAFLLLNIFIFLFIPPFGITMYLVEALDLNLTTPDTRLPICITQILLNKEKQLARCVRHVEKGSVEQLRCSMTRSLNYSSSLSNSPNSNSAIFLPSGVIVYSFLSGSILSLFAKPSCSISIILALNVPSLNVK